MEPVTCYIKERSFLARLAARYMGGNQIAMVIGTTIHLHGTSREDFLRHKWWVRHEICHVMQYKELGLVPFLWKYFWECVRVGYYANRFEVAARAAERDAAIMNSVRIV
jgi:hypothetical protein